MSMNKAVLKMRTYLFEFDPSNVSPHYCIAIFVCMLFLHNNLRFFIFFYFYKFIISLEGGCLAFFINFKIAPLSLIAHVLSLSNCTTWLLLINVMTVLLNK